MSINIQKFPDIGISNPLRLNHFTPSIFDTLKQSPSYIQFFVLCSFLLGTHQLSAQNDSILPLQPATSDFFDHSQGQPQTPSVNTEENSEQREYSEAYIGGLFRQKQKECVSLLEAMKNSHPDSLQIAASIENVTSLSISITYFPPEDFSSQLSSSYDKNNKTINLTLPSAYTDKDLLSSLQLSLFTAAETENRLSNLQSLLSLSIENYKPQYIDSFLETIQGVDVFTLSGLPDDLIGVDSQEKKSPWTVFYIEQNKTSPLQAKGISFLHQQGWFGKEITGAMLNDCFKSLDDSHIDTIFWKNCNKEFLLKFLNGIN